MITGAAYDMVRDRDTGRVIVDKIVPTVAGALRVRKQTWVQVRAEQGADDGVWRLVFRAARRRSLVVPLPVDVTLPASLVKTDLRARIDRALKRVARWRKPGGIPSGRVALWRRRPPVRVHRARRRAA